MTDPGVRGTPPSRRSTFVSGMLAGATVALAVVALAAVLTGRLDDDTSAADQAREAIEENYFEPVDASTLDEASITGMLDELRRRYDDRFSHYFSPKQLDEFHSSLSGEFSGVGLTVSEVKRGLRVATVLPDTPAQRARIETGDVITHVEGRSIAGLPAEVSSGRIKGPPGTEVELHIDPAGSAEPRDLVLERASVRIPAADGELRRIAAGEGPRIGYVRYSTFSRGAHGELRSAIEQLYRQGARGLVLDLRGNGGGGLNEAVLSASIFVENGVVVSTESRTEGDQDHEATGNALDPRPTVVLVDGDTASAAEILTAALADNDLATVVGVSTYGKGTVQELIELPAGGALNLTIGEYFTAEGKSVAGRGIKPEVAAKDDPDTRPDEALREALEVLAGELARSG